MEGLRTLLVDAKRFPRAKVCGGCLNRRGFAALQRAGIERVLDDCDSKPVDTLHWIVGNQQARFALPEMRVVDRANFDAALVHEATQAGAIFLDGVQACIEPEFSGAGRTTTLTRQTERITIQSRVVIAADGLSRSSLKRLPKFRSLTSPDSRIGVGATVPHDGTLARDAIMMIVGPHGYVGLAALGGGQLNVAAALDPRAVARSSVANLVIDMLSSAGIRITDTWRDRRLARHAPLDQPAEPRGSRAAVRDRRCEWLCRTIFWRRDGDGTGNGAGGCSAGGGSGEPMAPALATHWDAIQRQLVFESQATCRQLAWILRHGWVAAAAIGLCRFQPWVARRFILRVS